MISFEPWKSIPCSPREAIQYPESAPPAAGPSLASQLRKWVEDSESIVYCNRPAKLF